MLTAADAAQYLGASQSTLFIWRNEFPNKLPFITESVGKQKVYFYKMCDLEAFKLKREAEKSKSPFKKSVTYSVKD